LKNKVGNPL